jgi:hypothetical protein
MRVVLEPLHLSALTRPVGRIWQNANPTGGLADCQGRSDPKAFATGER